MYTRGLLKLQLDNCKGLYYDSENDKYISLVTDCLFSVNGVEIQLIEDDTSVMLCEVGVTIWFKNYIVTFISYKNIKEFSFYYGSA